MKKLYFISSLFFLGCTSNMETEFSNINQGDTKEIVISKIGNPDKITTCEKTLWWDLNYLGEDIEQKCKSAFWYEGKFLQRWYIGFDKDNQVITRYHYISE